MPNPVLTPALERLAAGGDLTEEDSAAVLREMMEGRASEAQTAAVLIALRAKGETVGEIVGLARTMRSLSVRVDAGRDDLLDTAGTGGGTPTFNVSTTAALVAAGAGCPVAKHGNRSATGRSGSADLLEALGARIDLEPGAVAECIDAVGFGFMFAPLYHGATRHVAPVRRELGVRTVFNLLGPLTNPAGATRQLIGVSDPAFLPGMAAALRDLGAQSALVVSSEDGLDEISVSASTRVCELADGEVRSYTVTPQDLGLEIAASGPVAVAGPSESAATARAVLSGAPGPERSLTVANAGAAIYVAGRAESLAAGARAAEAAIGSGAALAVLEGFVERSRALAPTG